MVVLLDEQLRVRSANPAFYELFQVEQAETEDHDLFQVGNGLWDVPSLRESLGQLLKLNGHLQDAEIEIVDIPPDELIERLKQGKVYVPHEATRALGHRAGEWIFERHHSMFLRERMGPDLEYHP